MLLTKRPRKTSGESVFIESCINILNSIIAPGMIPRSMKFNKLTTTNNENNKVELLGLYEVPCLLFIVLSFFNLSKKKELYKIMHFWLTKLLQNELELILGL